MYKSFVNSMFNYLDDAFVNVEDILPRLIRSCSDVDEASSIFCSLHSLYEDLVSMSICIKCFNEETQEVNVDGN